MLTGSSGGSTFCTFEAFAVGNTLGRAVSLCHPFTRIGMIAGSTGLSRSGDFRIRGASLGTHITGMLGFTSNAMANRTRILCTTRSIPANALRGFSRGKCSACLSVGCLLMNTGRAAAGYRFTICRTKGARTAGEVPITGIPIGHGCHAGVCNSLLASLTDLGMIVIPTVTSFRSIRIGRTSRGASSPSFCAVLRRKSGIALTNPEGAVSFHKLGVRGSLALALGTPIRRVCLKNGGRAGTGTTSMGPGVTVRVTGKISCPAFCTGCSSDEHIVRGCALITSPTSTGIYARGLRFKATAGIAISKFGFRNGNNICTGATRKLAMEGYSAATNCGSFFIEICKNDSLALRGGAVATIGCSTMSSRTRSVFIVDNVAKGIIIRNGGVSGSLSRRTM